MIKQLIFLLVIGFSFNSCKKEETIGDFTDRVYLDDGVYLILIGADHKVSSFIKKYNYKRNTRYNHVSILSVKKGEKIVYDVHPRKIKFTKKISVESLKSYLRFTGQKTTYFGIWRVKWITNSQLEKLIKPNQKILYDYKFDNKTENEQYCSEYVVSLLDKSLEKPFSWILLKKKLEKPEKFFLKKDSIIYYPVDFFLNNKNIVYINHWEK